MHLDAGSAICHKTEERRGRGSNRLVSHYQQSTPGHFSCHIFFSCVSLISSCNVCEISYFGKVILLNIFIPIPRIPHAVCTNIKVLSLN